MDASEEVSRNSFVLLKDRSTRTRYMGGPPGKESDVQRASQISVRSLLQTRRTHVDLSVLPQPTIFGRCTKRSMYKSDQPVAQPSRAGVALSQVTLKEVQDKRARSVQ